MDQVLFLPKTTAKPTGQTEGPPAIHSDIAGLVLLSCQAPLLLAPCELGDELLLKQHNHLVGPCDWWKLEDAFAIQVKVDGICYSQYKYKTI